MSKLDTLLEKFDEIKASSFNYNRDYNEVMRQIDELSFVAEIDKHDYYISMLEQIFVQAEDETWKLVTLTDEQREEFYLKGTISDYPDGFRIACSLHMYINEKEQYVQIFVSRNIIEEFTDPREDYGKVYTEYNKEQAHRPNERAEFRINELQEDDVGRKTLQKLIKVLELSKTNTVDVHSFDLKVKQDVSEHWGNLHHKEKLIDDEYQETNRPEYIQLPHTHKRYNIDLDIELRDTMLGPAFDTVSYDNGITRKFENLTKAESVFYSIADYINAGKIKPKVHPTKEPQHLEYLEKHYLSGKWPIAKDEAEAQQLRDELTKYEVSVTRFHDDVVFKLEVWEMGIVYIITNVWDRRSVN